jgi:hypothetical protein
MCAVEDTFIIPAFDDFSRRLNNESEQKIISK